MQDFNQFDVKSTTVETWNEGRREILQKMLGKVGGSVFIEAPFSVDYGCNVSIGEDCFINWKSVTSTAPPLSNFPADVLDYFQHVNTRHEHRHHRRPSQIWSKREHRDCRPRGECIITAESG